VVAVSLLLFNDTESDLQGKKALKLGYTTK
jgi:hypothetical protein